MARALALITEEVAMQHETGAGDVVVVVNMAEFFRDALRGVLADQRVAVGEQTEHYVVNMLTVFARTESLYESTSDGLRLKPLAQAFAEPAAKFQSLVDALGELRTGA